MTSNKHSAPQAALKAVDFDFGEFTVDSFVAQIERQLERRIFLTPWTMPRQMFGAWLTDGEFPNDYIFYDENVSQIHQTHIQLHELGHLLLGHETLKITTSELKKSIKNRDKSLEIFERVKLRSPRGDFEEQEAEHIAYLIKKKAIEHSRLHELIGQASSSSQSLLSFLQTMDL